MSPKVSQDFKEFQIFTRSDEGVEPMHIHVCKGKEWNKSLKFWYKNGGWEYDPEQSNLKVTAAEFKQIHKYLHSNAAQIIKGVLDFHMRSSTSMMNLR